MLREQFLGRCPSHFQINPIVKAFIISESLIWSAWNLTAPIAAVFVTLNVKGGNIQTAAVGYSVYLIARVSFGLVTGRVLAAASDRKKFNCIIIGLFFLTLSYLGFAFTKTLPLLYLSYILMGTGLGISSPPKSALFSVHLDKNKESTEWGLADGAILLSDAVAIIIGGFIATKYGFQPLFVTASIITLIATIPYLLRFDKSFLVPENTN